eukprot:Pgem_evm1s2128
MSKSKKAIIARTVVSATLFLLISSLLIYMFSGKSTESKNSVFKSGYGDGILQLVNLENKMAAKRRKKKQEIIQRLYTEEVQLRESPPLYEKQLEEDKDLISDEQEQEQEPVPDKEDEVKRKLYKKLNLENPPQVDKKTDDLAYSELPPLANKICAGFPQKKIAILMAGNARSLNFPIVYDSIKRNVIDALGGDSKLFMYLKVEDVNVKDGVRSLTHKKEDYFDVIEYLEPIRVEYGENTRIPMFRSSFCPFKDESKFNDDEYFQHTMGGELKSAARIWKMMESYERQNHMEFDIIVKIRPDSAHLSSFLPYCMFDVEKNVYSSKTYPGNLFVTSREGAKTWFKIYQYYHNDCSNYVEEADIESWFKTRVSEWGQLNYGAPFYPMTIRTTVPLNKDNTAQQSSCSRYETTHNLDRNICRKATDFNPTNLIDYNNPESYESGMVESIST